MGGDFGPEVTLPAAFAALENDTNLSLTLVGQQSSLASIQQNSSYSRCSSRISTLEVEGEVSPNDNPKQVIRQGAESSMGAAISLVGEACDGAVSAGSTAALMALGRQMLGMLESVDRPVLATAIPSRDNHTWLLDVGANLECSAEKLHRFAVLGNLLSRAQDGIAEPRVGLLNVGQEHSKGTPEVKKAAQLISENQSIDYVGFAEAGDLFGSNFDVVVADGFSGNVALKATEGTAWYIVETARKSLTKNFIATVGAWLMAPTLKRLKAELNPSRHNGAPLLGLQGLVVKSHGVADVEAFKCSIELAAKLARSGLVKEIGESINSLADKQL